MAKKTGFQKVILRKDYVIVNCINRLKNPPFKEEVFVYDFTGKYVYK